MSSVSVSVSEVRIPVDAVRRLSQEQRYTYYLLGLIHNEAMMLRKLISFTLPVHRDLRPFKRGPEMAQTLFLMRIGCCKLLEAQEKLNSLEVRSTLVADVYPRWSQGLEEQRELSKMMRNAPWLHALRNRIGFHYPSFEDWLPFTTPGDDWEDDIVYGGEEPGNQFLEAPEAIVRHQMFNTAAGESPSEQIENWVRQAVDLLVKLSDFTERAVWHFSIARLLPEGTKALRVGKVIAPAFDDVVIPFWTRPAAGRKVRGRI